MNTGMDDQLARCKVAEDEDWGIVQQSNQQLSTSVDELLKMKSKESINSPNGHTGLSIHILEGM